MTLADKLNAQKVKPLDFDVELYRDGKLIEYEELDELVDDIGYVIFARSGIDTDQEECVIWDGTKWVEDHKTVWAS